MCMVSLRTSREAARRLPSALLSRRQQPRLSQRQQRVGVAYVQTSQSTGVCAAPAGRGCTVQSPSYSMTGLIRANSPSVTRPPGGGWSACARRRRPAPAARRRRAAPRGPIRGGAATAAWELGTASVPADHQTAYRGAQRGRSTAETP